MGRGAGAGGHRSPPRGSRLVGRRPSGRPMGGPRSPAEGAVPADPGPAAGADRDSPGESGTVSRSGAVPPAEPPAAGADRDRTGETGTASRPDAAPPAGPGPGPAAGADRDRTEGFGTASRPDAAPPAEPRPAAGGGRGSPGESGTARRPRRPAGGNPQEIGSSRGSVRIPRGTGDVLIPMPAGRRDRARPARPASVPPPAPRKFLTTPNGNEVRSNRPG